MFVTPDTKVFASFGNPNRGNPGPPAYTEALRDAGVDAIFVVLEAASATAVAQGVRGLGLGGGTITKPFKVDIMAELDEIEADARAIGAVNVLVHKGGTLRGHNSDWHGALDALTAERPVAGARVALLGAGGAARAIAFGLQQQQANVTLFNRTESTGQQVSQQFGAAYGGSLAEVTPDFDVVINATNIGMNDLRGQLPISVSALSNQPLVFDIIGKPEGTALLDEARAHGCAAISGLAMVAHQATYALRWLTGAEVSAETIAANLR